MTSNQMHHHQATFHEVSLEEVDHRIYCIDIGANLTGDPFKRELSGEDANDGSGTSFDILWTDCQTRTIGYTHSN